MAEVEGEEVVPDLGAPLGEVGIENRSGRGDYEGGEALVAAWEHWDFPECGETGSESLGPCLLGQAGSPAARYLPGAGSMWTGS